MLSRSDRKRKKAKVAVPAKRLAAWASIAALCLIIVLFSIYESNRSKQAVDNENLPENPQATDHVTNTPGSSQEPEQTAPANTPTNEPSESAKPSPQATAIATTPAGATTVPLPTAKPTQTVAPQTPVSGAKVKLTFVGDVMFADRVEEQLIKNGYDYPYSFVKEYLQKADLTIANLETPITKREEAQSKEKYVYRSSPLALPAFKDAGFDLVNLANNHILDYGKEGLFDTFKELDKMGIKYVGAGKNADDAFKSVIIEKQGIKIAFLGFSRFVPEGSWKAAFDNPGVADAYNHERPVEEIKKAREKADLVVVIPHWGVERTDYPVEHQTDLAHRFIDAGADLIVASHPHVLQGLESYKGKWIAYSLGNFIFTLNEVQKTWESAILEATCSKERECNLQLVPIKNTLARPEIMTPELGTALFERLTKLSIKSKVDKDGKVIPLQKVKK
ncbi:CapA family protein [Paenibacillus eucommiae]|uniref:Poly-gamma-glutamate synthesis protein (Capsule biosynthesis protein) n=1 Tax=Paenibacillus eucommiae TaxID=1355755 RepID=A0ABS4IP10_9BACL|nr:CapA family protein [Paenibacillus eucommiae]MBP1989289.1 poly-gamma-glutamate synthesis protein (capsule biosynthesis protein) [Paenibacillus eucommiae]